MANGKIIWDPKTLEGIIKLESVCVHVCVIYIHMHTYKFLKYISKMVTGSSACFLHIASCVCKLWRRRGIVANIVTTERIQWYMSCNPSNRCEKIWWHNMLIPVSFIRYCRPNVIALTVLIVNNSFDNQLEIIKTRRNVSPHRRNFCWIIFWIQLQLLEVRSWHVYSYCIFVLIVTLHQNNKWTSKRYQCICVPATVAPVHCSNESGVRISLSYPVVQLENRLIINCTAAIITVIILIIDCCHHCTRCNNSGTVFFFFFLF